MYERSKAGAGTPDRSDSGQPLGGADREAAAVRLRLLESVVTNANDAVLITAAEPIGAPGPIITYVNDAFAGMTGWSPEEVVGRSPRLLQGPETDPGAKARIRSALERGEPIREELLNYRKDGTPFYVELNIVPVADERGRITHFASIQRDTTARRRREEELRQTRDSLRAVVEASPLAVVAMDADGVVELWNPAAERTFGWTRREVIGRPGPHIPRPEPDEFREAIAAALRGEVVTGVETVCRNKAGESLDVGLSAAPLRQEAESGAGVMTVYEDITERRRKDLALERLSRELELILDSLGEGVYGLDSEGLTTFANPAAERLLGWERGEMMGRFQHDLIHHSRRDGSGYPAEECPIYAALRDGKPHAVQDEVFWRKDGSSIDVEYLSAPIREDGRVTGAVVTFRDVTERRRAEEALRQSEARFRTALENAPIGMALVGLDGRFLSVNRALVEILGYEERELLALNFQQITHPDDLGADLAYARRLEAGEIQSYQMEKRYFHKDGRVIWALLAGSLVRDVRGEPLYFIAQVQDITERRQAREAQRRLTAILEATPDFVGIADAEGHALYLNRAGRAMVGMASDEDVSDRRIPDFHPEWAARLILEEGVPTAVREGVWTGETAILAPSGRKLPVSQVILSHLSPTGGVEYISTIVRDISERKLAEEAQRFVSEASRVLSGSLDFRGVLTRLLDLVVPRRADYCVIDMVRDDGTVNRIAVRHRDPRRQPVLEQLCRFTPPEDGAVGVAPVLRRGETVLVSEVSDAWLRAASQDDEHYRLLRDLGPASILVVPMRGRGRVIGAITLARTDPGERYGPAELAIAEDLAGRAGLALENARLYREVRQAVRMRDEVLRIVAHDLRDPLSTISLSVGHLLEAAPPGVEPERRHFEVIQRSVQRADRLIRDLLDVARMQAGRLSVEPTLQNPAELAREAVEISRTMARGKALRLELEVSDDLPPIRADRDRMLQVFSNLIGNAIKFTPEGGRILVRADRLPTGVRFSVTDSGPGIPEDQIPHLFDPFWQARTREGAGLGLAIARGIIEAHGGRIDVETRVGAGTTFHFVVPAGDASDPATRSAVD